MKIKKIYDVAMLPHNGYHVWTFALIARELKKMGISSCMFDLTNYHRDEGSRLKAKEFPDIPFLDYKEIIDNNVEYNTVICLNDWDKTTHERLLFDKKRGKKTVAIIEGINDFLDKDNDRVRNVYTTAEYLFLTGKYDKQFFKNLKTTVVGIPRLDELDKINNTVAKPIALINVNFTYNVLENKRDMWLESAIEGCKQANIDYIITQHPSDTADLSKYNVSKENVYSLMKKSSILISRFSSLILEALVMSKPVVYHNPHNEQARKFQEPLGAYSISRNALELANSIKTELLVSDDFFQKVNKFLDLHCNINNKLSSVKTTSKAIEKLISSNLSNEKIKIGSFSYANKLYLDKQYLNAFYIYIFLYENNLEFSCYFSNANLCYEKLKTQNISIDKDILIRYKKISDIYLINK